MNKRSCAVGPKQKCYLCGLSLAVPPVMMANSGNNEIYKCGRCKDIISSAYSWIRNRLFEEVAQNVSFPCSYPPCTAMIPWGEVEKHERNCPHRAIECPICRTNDGPVKIFVPNVWAHFTDKHPDNIATVDAMATGLTISNTSNTLYLMQTENQYFFVYFVARGKVAVLSIKHGKYTTFDVRLKLHSNDGFEMVFNGLPVVFYESQIHCFDCITTANDTTSLNYCQRLPPQKYKGNVTSLNQNKGQCFMPHHVFSKVNRSGIGADSLMTDLNKKNPLTSCINNYVGSLRYRCDYVLNAHNI